MALAVWKIQYVFKWLFCGGVDVYFGQVFVFVYCLCPGISFRRASTFTTLPRTVWCLNESDGFHIVSDSFTGFLEAPDGPGSKNKSSDPSHLPINGSLSTRSNLAHGDACEGTSLANLWPVGTVK